MLGYYQPEEALVHFSLACPVCNHDVHVVADLDRHRARWSCTQCLASGTAPVRSDALGQTPVVTKSRHLA